MVLLSEWPVLFIIVEGDASIIQFIIGDIDEQPHCEIQIGNV